MNWQMRQALVACRWVSREGGCGWGRRVGACHAAGGRIIIIATLQLLSERNALSLSLVMQASCPRTAVGGEDGVAVSLVGAFLSFACQPVRVCHVTVMKERKKMFYAVHRTQEGNHSEGG